MGLTAVFAPCVDAALCGCAGWPLVGVTGLTADLDFFAGFFAGFLGAAFFPAAFLGGDFFAAGFLTTFFLAKFRTDSAPFVLAIFFFAGFFTDFFAFFFVAMIITSIRI